MPKVSKNPVNIFNAQRNLLLLYTYSDIEKAKAHGEKMLTNIEDYLPVHNKDLTFMLANINFLAGDHEKAKNMYRHVLKLAPKPILEAQVLNNLAFTSWMHVLTIPKLDESQKAVKESILKDESYAMTYFKHSIEIMEKTKNPGVDQL
jgi:tetratricopeptide (TPR) repeat protein